MRYIRNISRRWKEQSNGNCSFFNWRMDIHRDGIDLERKDALVHVYPWGLCFVLVGLINEHHYKWNQSLILQSIIGAVLITALEFLTGCIVNLWLKWNVWDYSNLPFNLLGQICLYFFLLWIPMSTLCIVLDDWIRYIAYLLFRRFFPKMQERQRPEYYFWGKEEKGWRH